MGDHQPHPNARHTGGGPGPAGVGTASARQGIHSRRQTAVVTTISSLFSERRPGRPEGGEGSAGRAARWLSPEPWREDLRALVDPGDSQVPTEACSLPQPHSQAWAECRGLALGQGIGAGWGWGQQLPPPITSLQLISHVQASWAPTASPSSIPPAAGQHRCFPGRRPNCPHAGRSWPLTAARYT